MTNRINIDLVKEFFDQPDKYLHKRFGVRLRIKLLSGLLGKRSFTNVLDIGCGDGSLSLNFVDESERVVLVDLAPEMLKLARDNFNKEKSTYISKAEFLEGNFLSMSFNCKFDLVLLVGVIAHVPNVQKTVEKLREMTAEGGHVVLQFSDSNSLRFRLSKFFGFRKKGYQLNQTTLEDMLALIRSNDFEIVKMKKYMLAFPGMKVLPDKWLYKLQVFALSSNLLSPLTSDFMFVLKRK